ncbi:MAG TPA: class I SAM-dependent methyltransferase [Gammaproteobacteria bacterium]
MAGTGFKDHFSGASADYQRTRPRYPDALFAFLAAQAPAHHLAWDCATGTGQAAQQLADHFHQVIASDGSASQIASAQPHPRIAYRVATAEASGLASSSVDLVTVAQALHWFDIPTFFAEARRVLKPGGLIAIWSYNLLTIEPAIDAVINHLYGAVLDPYWPPERKLVENDYRDIAFPFRPLDTPAFAMASHWTLDQLLGYLRTWSAVRRYQEAQGSDPVSATAQTLAPLWGARDTVRTIRWPMPVRVGVNE